MQPDGRIALSLSLLHAMLAACGGAPPAPIRAPAAEITELDARPPSDPSESRRLGGAPVAAPMAAGSCADTADGFDAWLEAFRRHAVEQGISKRTVAIALAAAKYEPLVIERDRSQQAFHLSFEAFSAKRVTRGAVSLGRRQLEDNAELLAGVEARFGVQAEVLVAIWGLETGFGANTGNIPCLSALATLARDCRRAAFFRGELLSALRIVDRGDLSPDEMVGAWAGELGQTQFLPSSYERFAVDFDGDARADLLGSAPDALASTARFLQAHGWRAGEGYQPGSANFEVLRAWNKAEVYQQTIALFASKLAVHRARRTR